MKKIVLFIALAFTAMPGRASVPTGTATDTIVPSVLYAESVFDTLYPVFRKMYATFDSMREHRVRSRQNTRERVFGFARKDDGGTGHVVTGGWTLGFGTFPSMPGSTWNMYDLYDEHVERVSHTCVDTLLVPAVEAVTGHEGYSAETEKARMVREIETFGDTATALPTIYALIATKYGGDVRAYVDDLFDGSVMTSRRRLRRFMRSPITKRMREDMGFQFVVSKLMYRLWEAQGRPAQPAADGTRLVVLRSELEKR